MKPDAIVALDGSGDFRSVQEAIDAMPAAGSGERQWTIFLRPGIYREVVRVPAEKRSLRLVGEAVSATVIVADLDAKALGADGEPIGTFRTATFQIDANDFTAENVTFENSFGPGSQALAVRVDGDRAVFRKCRFLGYQDTILVNRGRHFFVDCFVAGAVDFIFGAATAYFDNCELRIVGNGYITAASTPEEQAHGMVFRGCRITAEDASFRVYLGRPWRDFAATVFIETEMSEVVRPEGWHNWGRPEREATSRYGEYSSSGRGAQVARRVAWARRLTEEEASGLTPAAVLRGGDGWAPAGVD